ncbi:hypothetical protein [Brenneria uluponensis]|uniref:hypothetical protein n=1 Tax=Brenneria uluponensis TaxID=3057057 RepID=UPI0028EAE7AC|nr:hypothetical protein [Brenneria ulupoensis]
MNENVFNEPLRCTGLQEMVQAGSVYVDIFGATRPDANYVEQAITQLALAMPQYKVTNYFMAKPETISNTDFCLFCYDKKTNNCCGFLSCNIITVAGKTCVMLYTLLISERCHGTRVTFCILQSLFSVLSKKVGLDYKYIILKTVNPRSFKIISSFSDIDNAVFFPRISLGNDYELSKFSTELANYLHPGYEYNKDNGIVYNASGLVPSDFYQEMPLCRDNTINVFFLNNMTLVDRMICILYLPDANARTQLYSRFKVT